MSAARKLTPTGYIAEIWQLALPVVISGNSDVGSPTINTATINAAGNVLTLTMSEIVVVADGSGFTASLSGGAAPLTYSSGSGTGTLVYSIGRTVYQGESGTLGYAASPNAIEDEAGNDLQSFSGFALVNNSTQFLDVTPPTVLSASINAAGNQLALTISEVVNFGVGGNGGLTLTMSGGAVTATYLLGAGTTTLYYSLSRTIYQGETGTRSYAQPGHGIEDVALNDMASFTAQPLINNSTQVQDVTVPVVNSGTINAAGTQITFALSESVMFGAGGNAGFVVEMSGGDVVASYISGASSGVLVYGLSRVVDSSETGTHSYIQPGNGVVDLVGNPLQSYFGVPVVNNSEAGELDAGAIVFKVPARRAGNAGSYFGLVTQLGEITKIAVDWSAWCAAEGADVTAVSWQVASGDVTVSLPTNGDNRSIVLLTTNTVTKGQIEITATLADGQKDVVCIIVRCRPIRR